MAKITKVTPKPVKKVEVKTTKAVVKSQPQQKKLVPIKRAMVIADSLSMESNKKSGAAGSVDPKTKPVLSKINKFVGGRSTSELLKSAGKDTKKAELIYKRVNEVSDKNNKKAPSSFYKSDYDSKRREKFMEELGKSLRKK